MPRKAYYWVKSVICRLSNCVCDAAENLPMNSNTKPNCSICDYHIEWKNSGLDIDDFVNKKILEGEY